MRLSHFVILAFPLFLVSCNSCENEQGIETDTLVNETIQEASVDSNVVDSISIVDDEPGEKSEETIQERESKEQVNPESKTTPEVEPEKETAKKESIKSPSVFIQSSGKEIPKDFKANLATYAAEEVLITKEDECDEFCGKKVYLKNLNEEKAVTVAVQINWKKDGKRTKLERVYNVEANQKVWAGCTQNCTDPGENVKWKIISATYLN